MSRETIQKQAVDVAILIALREEWDVLWTLAGKPRGVKDPVTGRYLFSFDVPNSSGRAYRCIALCMGDMGPVQATDAAHLLLQSNPRIMLNLGIAAAIHDDLRLCDVIVADQVDEYFGTVKAAAQGKDDYVFEFRGSVYKSTYSLVQDIDNLKYAHPDAFEAWRSACERMMAERSGELREIQADANLRASPEVSRVHLASGPVLVAADAFSRWIRTRDGHLKALEMESAGMMLAAHQRSGPMATLVMRGISDLGDHRKSRLDRASGGVLRYIAMANVTQLLWSMMERGLLPQTALSGGDVVETHHPDLPHSNPSTLRLQGAESNCTGRIPRNPNVILEDSPRHSTERFVDRPAKMHHRTHNFGVVQSEGYAELFGKLKSLGVREDTVHQLHGWPNSDLCSLVETCLKLTNSEPRPPPSLFTFTANGQLSGAPSPCVDEECRLASLNQMARFAALYAEHIIVQNPFERHGAHGTPDFRDDPKLYNRRYGLICDLRILFLLRPLIEAGIVSFTKSAQHFCPFCVYEAQRRGRLAELVGKSESKGWQRRVGQMVACLKREFSQRATIVVRKTRDGDGFEVDLSADEGLVEHGGFIMGNFEPDDDLAERARRGPVVLRPQDFWKARVLRHPIERIIEDITVQNYFANLNGSNYLTGREIDLKLLDAVCKPEFRSMNQNMINGLGHPVPYVDQIPIADLLKLRETHGEAFYVYRDAVSSVVRSVGPAARETYQEAIGDVVRPELERIDAVIEKARSGVWRSAATSISLGVGLVSIGMFGGLIPSQTGAAIAALGALGGLKVAGQLAQRDEIAEDNRFFFLWKLRQSSR